MPVDPWPGLEIRHLVALVAVADYGGISRAAEQLGYTQSAVSQQVAALERLVGAPVFDRPGGPRPLRLTEVGEALLGHARTALGQIRAAESDVRAVVAGDQGRVRVGTVQSVGTKILPEVFRRYHELRPGVAVELEESHDPAILLGRVLEGELELTFAEEPLPTGPWATRHVLDDPFVLLAPAGSPEADRRTVGIEEIVDLPLIGYRNPSCLSLTIGVFDRLPQSPRFVFHSDDNGTIQGCVGAGLGFALVPLLTVDADDAATTIVPLDPAPGPRRIHVAWHADRPLGPAQQEFVDVVAAVCADFGRAAEAA
jgi:DNA-binding transcriptional LysR family regulator